MTNVLELPSVKGALRDPVDGSTLAELNPEQARFSGGRCYPCIDGRPILIDQESSLFSLEGRRPKTHSHGYRDPAKLLNYIRRRVLPGLTWNRNFAHRVEMLTEQARGGNVLVIGAGDRIDEYRKRFAESTVVTSDIHVQYGADCGVDAHRIPFADRTFDLVLADQVLEHTARPWVVATEMQRVTRIGGTVHVEVPFNFPYHGAPYDFFRFTPSALRLMFAESALTELDITEGRFSAAAVYLSSGVIDSFLLPPLRRAALLSTRLGLWWIKYLDAAGSGAQRFHSPKGLYITLRVEGILRSERELLHEITRLVRRDVAE